VDAIDVVTDRDAFRRTADGTDGDGVRVPVEVRTRVDDPFQAYRRARDRRGGFLLETTGGRSGWSYFGVDPVRRLQVGPGATVRDPGTDGHGPTLAALDALLAGERLARGDCDVPYPCGAFGWLSYDLARELEDLPGATRDDRGLPRLQVGVYDAVAAWEEPRPDDGVLLRVTACPRVGDDADAAYDRGCERAVALARAATTGDPGPEKPPVATRTATFESDVGRDAFADRVRRVKSYVREGETFQVNVSHRLTAPAAVHPVAAYAALRRVNPAPYSALVEFPGVDLVSASPELLLHRDGDRVETEPIAGTRPRGNGPEEDEAFEADLLADEKERAEHAMLVDLERNDLGRVCVAGGVDVREYRRVDRYAEVMHLVSRVEGELRADAGLVDAVAATFPGGTVTGAPKPRTMEIIDELETTRRGPYTGSVAAFGFDGRATLSILIRTLVRADDEYHLRVGAGVVHDSVPDREYRETLDKARGVVTAVDEALDARVDLAVEGPG
jgi:anthranilate synthase component 1